MEHALEVVKAFNGFYIYLDNDRDCRGMGDGVDEVFAGLRVGEEGFVEAWQREIDENLEEYLEAYFPYVFDAPAGGIVDLLEDI